ncbi:MULTISPECIES: GNAT family N-acetyltransferase [Pseudoalteromonas]|uniref:N-acetyltransferase n=2 Tax=Pseudoalteromonas TaxID=53246 RepID=A0ABQ6RMR2_9GAMM|nr:MULTISPECIES: GNAT family N-acetyltransferase [Pseudoalteromonas]ATG79724.1 phosphinothricin acetyltransferase [Pseudoalteromonas sp. 1_2015MBL_MicDiv]KAA1164650.1 N-acetyltransferase [Pseudoalteromonas fuliginea]KAA1169283.1 N-acetyltransferase [Pseudoalteromonas fuliginea]
MIIRAFDKADYPSVQSIYKQGIDTGNATFQQVTKSWDEWNNSMLSHSRIVAVDNNNILGWAALSAISTREVYSGVAEVSVYVALDAQGKGIGQKLLSNLISDSERNNIWMLQAAIFPENKGSLKLHKNNNFRQLGIREKLGQMNNVWRDVVLIERRSKVVGV